MRCLCWLWCCLPTLAWGQGAVAPNPAGPAGAKGTAYTWVSSDTSATARQFVARCLTPANPDGLVPHGKRATPLAAHDTVAIECHRLTRTPAAGCAGWYAYRLLSQAWAVPHLRDHSGQHFSFHNYFVLADGHLTVFNTRDRAANERLRKSRRPCAKNCRWARPRSIRCSGSSCAATSSTTKAITS